MEDRKYGIKLFLYDEPEFEKDIEFYQNDTNTCIINISLYRDRLTKYSVNGTVSILINKNDGTVVVDTLTKVNEGDYTYILPNSAINVVGNHSVTVQCHGTNNDRITFASFKYKVKSDVRSGDISSQSDYPILTKLISDNNELNQKVSSEENLREFNEEKRKANESLRQQDYEKAIQEYESYKNVMIAESNVAALQNQINAGNAQLAEMKYISNLVAVELEDFPKLSIETNDYPRVMRALSYCKDNNLRVLRLTKDIDIANNIIVISQKFFSMIGKVNNDIKVKIKGLGEKIISVQEQGFAMDTLSIQGDLIEDADWNLSKTVGISYDYLYQDMDSSLFNVTFSNCNKCIDFKGRNLELVNPKFVLSNIGINISKLQSDLNNPNGTDIRGIRIFNPIFHTMGKNDIGKGDCCVVVNDYTNGQDIQIINPKAEQGCKQFFRGYYNGVNIENISVSNCKGKGKFIELYERPSGTVAQTSSITGKIKFSGNMTDFNPNNIDVAENAICANGNLENCSISITSFNTRGDSIKINGNLIESTIDSNYIYNPNAQYTYDGDNKYSGIKIEGNLINSTVFNNYINGMNKKMKSGIHVIGDVVGSYIDENRIFYAVTSPIIFKSSDGLSEFNKKKNGTYEIINKNSKSLVPNSSYGTFIVKALNGDTVFNLGDIRFVYNSGEKGKENTNIQFFINNKGVYERILALNSLGNIIENGKYLGLSNNNYLWVDSQGKLRIKNGVPVSDTDGTIVGSQS